MRGSNGSQGDSPRGGAVLPARPVARSPGRNRRLPRKDMREKDREKSPPSSQRPGPAQHGRPAAARPSLPPPPAAADVAGRGRSRGRAGKGTAERIENV